VDKIYFVMNWREYSGDHQEQGGFDKGCCEAVENRHAILQLMSHVRFPEKREDEEIIRFAYLTI
jgi:hypothetical protein